MEWGCFLRWVVICKNVAKICKICKNSHSQKSRPPSLTKILHKNKVFFDASKKYFAMHGFSRNFRVRSEVFKNNILKNQNYWTPFTMIMQVLTFLSVNFCRFCRFWQHFGKLPTTVFSVACTTVLLWNTLIILVSWWPREVFSILNISPHSSDSLTTTFMGIYSEIMNLRQWDALLTSCGLRGQIASVHKTCSHRV